jgi:hypothetical protein
VLIPFYIQVLSIQILLYTDRLLTLMTSLHIKIDKKKVEHLKEIIKDTEYKSISDFVRNVIDEKTKILESKKQNEGIMVPDWIPDGMYYAIVKGMIVAVGDSPSSIAQEVAFKFPFEKVIIDRKNKEIPELEYAYYTQDSLAIRELLKKLVGETRFELATSCSQGKNPTQIYDRS